MLHQRHVVGLHDAAPHALHGRAEAVMAHDVVRDQRVDIGLPHAADVGFVHVFLGIPPAVVSHDDVLLHDGGDLHLFVALAPRVFQAHPFALCHADLGGKLRVHGHHRIRLYFAQHLRLAVLRMERRPVAGTRGDGQRVLFLPVRVFLFVVGHEARGGAAVNVVGGNVVLPVVAEHRLFVVGKRISAAGREHEAVQFHLAGSGVEAGLAVGAQHAALVLAILGLAAHLHVLLQVLPVVPEQHHLGKILGYVALYAVHLALAVHVEVVVERRALRQVMDDLEFALALAHRLDGLHHGLHRTGMLAHQLRDVAVVLQPRGQRQEQIAARCYGGVHEDVLRHHEVHALQRLVPALRRGRVGGRHRVGVQDPAEAHRIRLVGLQRGQKLVRHGLAQKQLVDGIQIQTYGAVALLLRDRVRGHRLLLLVGRRFLAVAVVGLAAEVQRDVPADVGAAGNVQVARDGHQGVQQMHALHAVGVLVVGQAHVQAPGLFGQAASDRTDGLGGNLGDLRRPFHAVFHAALLELVPAVAPLLHEVVIVQVFVDEHADEAERQRRVGVGAQLQVVQRAGGKPVHARVDVDELGAALQKLDDGMAPRAVRIGAQAVAPPVQQVLRLHEFGVVVASGQAVGEVVLDVARAADHGAHRVARSHAREAGLRVALVSGHADARRGVGHVAARLTTRAGEHGQAVRAVLFLALLDFFLDLVVRPVPRDPLPGVGLAAVGRVAVHGMHDAVRVVDQVEHAQAAHAQTPFGDGVVHVAFDLDALAVLHVSAHAATHAVAARRRPGGRAVDFCPVLQRPGLRCSVFFDECSHSKTSSFLSSDCKNKRSLGVPRPAEAARHALSEKPHRRHEQQNPCGRNRTAQKVHEGEPLLPRGHVHGRLGRVHVDAVGLARQERNRKHPLPQHGMEEHVRAFSLVLLALVGVAELGDGQHEKAQPPFLPRPAVRRAAHVFRRRLCLAEVGLPGGNGIDEQDEASQKGHGHGDCNAHVEHHPSLR